MGKSESSIPLSFSDEQLTQIFRAAAPLTPDQRLAFLEDLASSLRQASRPLGDGLVYRTVREVQRRYFDPPSIDGVGASQTWDR